MKIFYEKKKEHSPICYTVYQVRKSKYNTDYYDIYAKTVFNGDERFKCYNLAFRSVESAREFLNV